MTRPISSGRNSKSRLLIESFTFAEWTTLTGTLIVTSSAGPGTALVSQFAAVSQLLSLPPPVQLTAESSVLGSTRSILGDQEAERFVCANGAYLMR